VIQEAHLSQRDRAAASLNFGKNISANSVHLRLIVKHVGDFLLVLIELFFARWYG